MGGLTYSSDEEELDCISNRGSDGGGIEDAKTIGADLDLVGCGVDDGNVG